MWQGLCSIAGRYVRRAYNSAPWEEGPCAFVPAAMRRPRACSSRRSGLVTALCAAVGIAFLLAPPPAFAQSTTLVSNLDRPAAYHGAAGIYAQGFRTGANTAGYTITNVQVRLIAGSVTSSTKTSVLIRQERNGEPGALVTSLTTQTPLVDGVNTFAAPANTTLNPRTNYFITVNETLPAGVPFTVSQRAVYEFTGRGEQSGTDGWRIDDKLLFKNHLSQDWGTSNRQLLFIGVNGDGHTTNTEPPVEIVPPTVDGTVPDSSLVTNTHLRRQSDILHPYAYGGLYTGLWAQGFVTGSNRHGYTVTEIDIVLNTMASPEAPTVELHHTPHLNGATRFVSPPIAHRRLAAGQVLTYRAPSGTRLNPSTRYYVRVRHSSSSATEAHRVVRVRDDGEAGAPGGWSIDDNAMVAAKNNVWNYAPDPDRRSLQIGVKGFPNAGTPGAPTGLVTTADGTDRIDLSWHAPSDTGAVGVPVGGYRIEVSTDGGATFSDLVANTTNADTTYAHTGFQPGETRHYRVSAITSGTTGNASGVANATTDAVVPGAPTGLTATANGETRIDLTWTAPEYDGGSTITGYRIEVSTGPQFNTLVADTGNANTSYSHTDLQAGDIRHYRVSAINSAGTGDPSNIASATIASTTGQAVVDPPTVVGTPVVSGAGSDGTWTQGETVGVTVTFSEAVNVDTSGGTPSIGIGLGGTVARSATYASGTGTTELVFGYTLVQGDGSHSLMAVTPASLALNGGTIRSAANQTNAQLAHNGTVSSSTLATVPEPSAPGVPEPSAPGVPTTRDSLVTNTHLRRQSDILHPDAYGGLYTGLWAQGFVTGSNRHGYTVTEIDIVLNTMASPEAPTVELHHTPHLNGATRFVSPPIAHRRLAAGQVLTYRAPSGTRLNPSTRYYVRVRHSSSSATEAHRVVRVRDDGEAGAPGGWSIDDNAMVAAKNNVWNYAPDPDRRSLQIGVKGFPNAGTPGAPTGLVTTADGTDRIDLSWHAPSDTGAVGVPVGGYRIEVSTDGGATFSDLVANTTNADTTYAHTGFQPGETRHYRVSAITSGTTGNASGVANATTDAVVPGAPTGLTATANGETRIDLTWTAPEYDGGSTITGYRIAVSSGPQFNTLVADTGNANTSYSHTDLQDGDIRHYRVSAINSAGAGDPSNIASATIASTAVQVVVDPPTVDGTPSVSGAGTDAQWSVGETVGVTVTFSEAVDVDTSGGTPSIGISLGGTAARSATYASGTGTTELVFGYTLVLGDGSHSLMAVTPASLALNGGTIRSAANQTNAQLAHNGTVVLGSSTRSTVPEASFQDVPKSHDGATAFTVGVQFSGQPAGLSATRDAASVLEVTGGSVTSARVTSKSANPAWEVTVAPDGLGEVTIEVPVRACTEANAVCIGGRSLSRAVETTVPGTPMTARFTQTPSAHDGSNGFELHMEFSHEPENFSYRTVQDALFDIEGGRIERVWRRERGKGRQWGIVVAPGGGGAVTLAARATTDCAAQYAACDAEGRKFAGDLSLTVPGPSSPPVVSIAASATPVTEGTAAAFTLSRTGATDAALTVTVSVSESKASVSGTPPTSVTFAAGSASATLSVATEDDETVEDASTVTATVSSGSGYTVSGPSGTADVVVEDDDAAPVVTTASPIVVAENATSVATLSATDADTAVADLSWSIPAGAAGGADAAKFALTAGGVLTFKAAKDYESPDDADTDGEYEVTVRVNDGANAVDAALVVRLSDVDEVAPTLSSASVDGDALALTFDEALDGDSVPPKSAFAVTVAGAARGVDTVAVSEKVVTLTLSSSVSSGETVTVGYTVPTGAGAKPVKDAVGNAAATFSSAGVTNATAALPVVSIAASATPVTEGAAAAFTLSRTGATDAALTVSVSVSESEASVSGTPPTSVTFAAASASATLSVATEDDEVAEDASTVTATVSSGSGYTVSGTSASADVVVEDDDAAPVVTTASPIVVAENATSVATLSATDADTAAADLSWSIPAGAAGGADRAKFALTADGALSFTAAKDFEAPDDADADGAYEVTVRVTDGVNPVDAALVVRLEGADDDTGPTASLEALPERHDGTAAFRFELHFSEAPSGLSYRTVGGGLLEVTGGTLTHARRLTRGSNQGWEVTVEPTQAGDIVITLPARSCGEADAICIDGEPLARAATATVPGPASSSLPVVSIAASATPVTEGAAAAFTLSRTGATDAALTVSVSVSESEASVSGTPPTSVTFAAASASATLSVATEDDEVAEDASTVTATVSSGSGYTVSGTSASADVVVEDDDATPVVTTASPIVVAENATSVATLSATDADTAAADLSWSIPAGAAGGADAAQFALTADGVLSFTAAKDYEAPDDADADGAYEVTVRVTDGANPVDAALVVRLSDVDDVAPVLSSASVDGAVLTLTFGEALDTASQPASSSFAVSVAGSARTVDAVAVSEKVVALTLSSAVTSGQTVTVGYTVPTGAGAKPVQDAAGNPAASFANTNTTNATDALPVVLIAPAATPVTEGTAAAFVLTRTGATDAALTVAVSVSESEAAVSGTPPTSVTFAAGSASATLSVATEDDEVAEDASTVTVTVSSGSDYTVDGTSGSAEAVVNDDDDAPAVTTASPIVVAENATAVATLSATDADTAAADLSWSIPEDEAGGVDGAQFTLSADGELLFREAKDYEAPDDADADGAYEVTVRVTDGANPVDAALVVRLEDADDAAPALTGASVDGAALTLTFGEALDGDSVPPPSSFAVTVAGSARAIDSAAVSGSTVGLTLSSAVTSGETVTVGYTVPTGADVQPVQDAAGNPAVAFANTNAINTTAAALPGVSIAPASTPVTEGTAAAFVLTRTGATAAELTVTVQVSEAGSVLDGTPPWSATFASGSAETRLSVATENDAADEADARVSASIMAGDGYEVDAERASTGVDVFDDDAAVQVAAVEELWSATLTWTDLGNNWFGGFADGFSNPGWSEDGQAFRIWYISYDVGARTLLMAHDGSGGLIGEPGELSLHVGGHEVGAGEALSAFAGARVGRVGGVDAQWSVGEEVTVRLTRASGDAEAGPAGPGFSVADAQANEASGVPLRFRVTLDAPAQSTVSVRYRTANGTAQAGADYVAGRGAVRFARGETAKTIAVAVVQDSHDEGSETMTLTLSGPHGATVADGTATGTISNTGPIPQAWSARFGRTVAEQAIDAVQARFEAPRTLGLAGTIAGQPLASTTTTDRSHEQVQDAREGLENLAKWFDGTPKEDNELGTGMNTLTGGEVLSTSSFALTEGTAESGFASFWGRGAVTHFDGRDEEMTLDGEVASAMLGADFSRDAWLGGVMVSHSLGKGGYRSSDSNGEVESTLTALFPYARYTLSERVSVWGMAGYGEGTLTVTPEGSAPLRPDMDLLMGALGVRGVLVDGGADGPTLTAKSDAFAVHTSTDSVSGSAGNLEASKADVTRVRFALEGSRPVRLGESVVLTPSLELGVRHDGGDAETGFGADIGAGLALSDPTRGISAEVRARGLLTHEAQKMRERGLSGTLAFDPAPDTERGLSVSLTQTVGAQGAGGADALLERRTLAGLGAEEDGALSARRLDTRIGYGLGVFDNRWTAVPELGLGLSERDREVRLGWRLVERVTTGLAFELGVEGTRREWTDTDDGAEHGIGIGAGWRLAGARASHGSLEMRVEAARRDVANDDRAPEHTIGLNVRARW